MSRLPLSLLLLLLLSVFHTGACPYSRPCAQQYVGKSHSCMVISGRLIVHASYHMQHALRGGKVSVRSCRVLAPGGTGPEWHGALCAACGLGLPCGRRLPCCDLGAVRRRRGWHAHGRRPVKRPVLLRVTCSRSTVPMYLVVAKSNRPRRFIGGHTTCRDTLHGATPGRLFAPRT